MLQSFIVSIQGGDGFTLALVGMGTVFIGLLILLCILYFLRAFVIIFTSPKSVKYHLKSGDLAAEAARVPKAQEKKKIKKPEKVYPEEIASAICMALYLSRMRKNRQVLRIISNDNSNWKFAHKGTSMESL